MVTSEQTTAPAPAEKPRASRSIADLLRSLAVVAAIVLVLFVVNYRAPEDPVKQIDPAPLARQISSVAPFEVLVPTDPGWRPTATRWETTQESAAVEVWFVGGVYGPDGPFASLTQSQATTPEYLAEQTGEGAAAGTSEVAGRTWQRYEADDGLRSLVLIEAEGSTIASGTGSWGEVERFAASLEPAFVE